MMGTPMCSREKVTREKPGFVVKEVGRTDVALRLFKKALTFCYKTKNINMEKVTKIWQFKQKLEYS